MTKVTVNRVYWCQTDPGNAAFRVKVVKRLKVGMVKVVTIDWKPNCGFEISVGKLSEYK